MKWIICFFKGHRMMDGVFVYGNVFYRRKCERCKGKFDIPSLTEEYVNKHFPTPKIRPLVTKDQIEEANDQLRRK